jgi:hypothetical protein
MNLLAAAGRNGVEYSRPDRRPTVRVKGFSRLMFELP